MTASRKQDKRDRFGAVPLPAHFGKIDANAPFNAERYFTVLRSVGENPIALRQPDGTLSEQRRVLNRKRLTRLKLKRLEAAYEWADKKDPKRAKRAAYVQAAVLKSPFSDIAYLGSY